MADSRFFARQGPFTLAQLGAALDLDVQAAPDLLIHDVAGLDEGGAGLLTYVQGPRAPEALARLAGGACLIAADLAARVPAGVIALTTAEPRRAFARAAALFYPRQRGQGLHHATAWVDPTATIGADVDLGPHVVIGAHAQIGDGAVLSAGVVIGEGVALGRDAWIGPLVSISHALIGDRVTLHAGARIGQDGFGVVPGPKGFTKVPQLGRVIIQDDVEIGANTCIDRGALGDTVIGEGTWLDNLVQIGHNVRLGRYCVFAAQVGLSGSIEVGDFVAIGGQAGAAPHLKIGTGAEIGAQAGLMRDVAPKERVLGSPAMPIKQFLRAFKLFEKSVEVKKSRSGSTSEDG